MRLGGQRDAPASFTPEKRLGERKSVPFGESNLDPPAVQSVDFVTTVTELSSECTKFPQNLRLITMYLPPWGEGKREGGKTKPKFTSENLKKRGHSDKIIQILNTISVFNEQFSETLGDAAQFSR
jgi:hypothetical protein